MPVRFHFNGSPLVSSAADIIMELSGSMRTLLTQASVLNYVQMQAGSIDQSAIDDFTAQHQNLITRQQTVSLLNVGGSNIQLGTSGATQADSVMDIAFVTQNQEFDFLLDTNNQILQIADGQVAIPVYYNANV